MTQKDLEEEYLDRKIKQEPFKSLTKGFEYAFSADDIKAAFNAGRESVVENIPDLKWNNEDRFGDLCECTEEGYSDTPFGIYSILQWYNSPDIAIYFAGEHFKSNFQSVE